MFLLHQEKKFFSLPTEWKSDTLSIYIEEYIYLFHELYVMSGVEHIWV